MTNSVLRRAAAVAATGAAALLLSACTADTTRGRVEHDFAATFSNQYAQSLQRQGKSVKRPQITSTVCHSGTNLKVDSGPGTWSCEFKYVGADGTRHDDTWVSLVDALACCQPFSIYDPLRFHTITDVYSHKSSLDPAGSFDGCYDVYDGRTNTSKKKRTGVLSRIAVMLRSCPSRPSPSEQAPPRWSSPTPGASAGSRPS